jgi:hypothetical protein
LRLSVRDSSLPHGWMAPRTSPSQRRIERDTSDRGTHLAQPLHHAEQSCLVPQQRCRVSLAGQHRDVAFGEGRRQDGPNSARSTIRPIRRGRSRLWAALVSIARLCRRGG